MPESFSDVLYILENYKYIIVFPLTVLEGPIISVISGFLVYLGVMNFWGALLVLVVADVYDGTEKLCNTLGTELDFTSGYVFNDVVSLQLGYSQFLAATTFEYLQEVGNPSSVQNWGYVALLVRPGMRNKFVGLMF